METRITKLLGSKYPMIQGGYGVDRREHTGICGIQCRSSRPDRRRQCPIDYLREQIPYLQENAEPFGVNIMLMSPTRRSGTAGH